ncbi:hypothetical protein [Nostoc sp. DSM 114160]
MSAAGCVVYRRRSYPEPVVPLRGSKLRGASRREGHRSFLHSNRGRIQRLSEQRSHTNKVS